MNLDYIKQITNLLFLCSMLVILLFILRNIFYERIYKKTMEKDKQKLVDSALKEIEKMYGKGAVMKLGEQPKVEVDSISTGSMLIDDCLGIGGIPKGRIIEIYGVESSGKSTLCLQLARECQKNGGAVAYIDSEHAMNPEYAEHIGVNTEELVFSQPDSGEQALEIAEKLVKSGGFDLIIIDSVAALTPQAELDGEMGDQNIGLLARLNKNWALA